MDASELREYFSRQDSTERWQVLSEQDATRLVSPHGPQGDITISSEIADAAGLQHARPQAAAQLAVMFERAEQGNRRGGRY